jgi:CO dehydrogenase/acetyl-CoA synthase beta subunit
MAAAALARCAIEQTSACYRTLHPLTKDCGHFSQASVTKEEEEIEEEEEEEKEEDRTYLPVYAHAMSMHKP